MFVSTLLRVSGENLKSWFALKVDLKNVKLSFFDGYSSMCTSFVARILHIWPLQTLATCASRLPVARKLRPR